MSNVMANGWLEEQSLTVKGLRGKLDEWSDGELCREGKKKKGINIR